MKNKAFTLVEMLAVVLIIGVLAAIMVPKYRFAIEKTHAAERMQLAADIYRAQQQYYLAVGGYASSWDSLDETFTRCPSDDKANYSCNLKNAINQVAVMFKFAPSGENKYNFYVSLYDYGGTKKGAITCEGNGAEDSLSHKICEAFCLNKTYNQVWNRSCLVAYI